MSDQSNMAPSPAADLHAARRRFMSRVAGLGAVVAAGASPAQAQAPAAPPEAPGSISNAAVMAGKDSVLRPHSERPLTASATAEHQNFLITPTRRMFVRNNLNTPEIDAGKHVLTVRGLVDRELTLTLDDLRKMNVWQQVAMLECAGSGRTAFRPTPRGTTWPDTGGMGCPQWQGVSLAEILRMAGVRGGAEHVAFFGLDRGPLPTIPPVVRSIPMAKAMERHTMVALGMNDAPLSPVHGFPMRSLVPGWVGSASIKWLSAIEVLPAPFKGTYMDDSYRIPRVPVAPGDAMPPDAASTEDWPVKSMITFPAPNARFRVGQVVPVEGRAWVGESQIRRVDLSFDEGVTWQRASLDRRTDRYAWRRFSADYYPEKSGFQTVLARATDDRGNVQPFVPPWNPLGYYWNGVHRVGFSVDA